LCLRWAGRRGGATERMGSASCVHDGAHIVALRTSPYARWRSPSPLAFPALDVAHHVLSRRRLGRHVSVPITTWHTRVVDGRPRSSPCPAVSHLHLAATMGFLAIALPLPACCAAALVLPASCARGTRTTSSVIPVTATSLPARLRRSLRRRISGEILLRAESGGGAGEGAGAQGR